MKSKCLVLLILYNCFLLVPAQIPKIGDCQTFENCKTYNTSDSVNKLNGTWYLVGGSQFFFDENTKCDGVQITVLPDDYVLINKTRYDVMEQRNTFYTIFGQYLAQNGSYNIQVGELQVPIPGEYIEINNNYFIWVSCSDCGYFTKDRAGIAVYIYSKTQKPSQATFQEIFDKLEDCLIPTVSLVSASQTGCNPSGSC